MRQCGIGHPTNRTGQLTTEFPGGSVAPRPDETTLPWAGATSSEHQAGLAAFGKASGCRVLLGD
jgi:hypothetical protein